MTGSALVVLVPKVDRSVKPFRDRYDPSAATGMPAHITASYPFKPLVEVDEIVLRDLRQCFARSLPIRFALGSILRFPAEVEAMILSLGLGARPSASAACPKADVVHAAEISRDVAGHKLDCSGFDSSVGPTAAQDIQVEFREHRPWHQVVTCRFEDARLILRATNDFDEAGLALQDEFSDCLSAFLREHGGDQRVLSVEAGLLRTSGGHVARS